MGACFLLTSQLAAHEEGPSWQRIQLRGTGKVTAWGFRTLMLTIFLARILAVCQEPWVLAPALLLTSCIQAIEIAYPCSWPLPRWTQLHRLDAFKAPFPLSDKVTDILGMRPLLHPIHCVKKPPRFCLPGTFQTSLLAPLLLTSNLSLFKFAHLLRTPSLVLISIFTPECFLPSCHSQNSVGPGQGWGTWDTNFNEVSRSGWRLHLHDPEGEHFLLFCALSFSLPSSLTQPWTPAWVHLLALSIPSPWSRGFQSLSYLTTF